jgi:hypothetical protein
MDGTTANPRDDDDDDAYMSCITYHTVLTVNEQVWYEM